MQLVKLKKIKIMVKLAITLLLFERRRIKRYLMPNKYGNERVLLAKKQRAASK